MNIDGIEYRPVTSEGEELRLVIVDNRGLMFVGFVDIYDDNRIATIRDARCVIGWGTKHHIAELVDGPLENTVLGAKADVEFVRRNMIISYRVSGDWYA